MTISFIKAATITLLIGAIAMTACSGQEAALPPAPPTADTDAHTDNQREPKPIDFGVPKGHPNPAVEVPPAPKSVRIEERGDLPVEQLKAELLEAGVKPEIINSIGDGSDPIFQANRYGMRPPSDLMAVIKDFAGWKLYARQGWFSKSAAKRRRPWRTGALKIGYPYEVIVPILDHFTAQNADAPISENSFANQTCWIFPLMDGSSMTGQIPFWYKNNQWTATGGIGIPSGAAVLESRYHLDNKSVRRVYVQAFGGFEDIVGYIPSDSGFLEGLYFYWEKKNADDVGAGLPARPETEVRKLDFAGLGTTLRSLAKKYNIAESLKPRSIVEGGNRNVDK